MEYDNYEGYKKPKLISEDILRISKKVAVAFTIILVVLLVASVLLYSSQKELIDQALADAMENFDGLITKEGEINTVSLILNNIRVCFTAAGLGIIPFLYLPVVLILVNATVIAVIMAAIASASPLSMVSMFALGILPHGIFEFPAIFLAIGSGLWLCKVLTHKLLRKNPEVRVGEELKNILKVLFLVCVPLMIIAGIIETTVTPYLLTRFIM